MRPEKYILMGMGIVVAILINFLVGRRCPRESHTEPPKPRVDTLYIRDTIKVAEPKYITKRVIDSILVPVTDTLYLKDTLFVVLEKEQVTWEDSLARVYASGVNPQVDSVIHYNNTKVITKEIPIEIKKTRWGIGVQAGVTIGKDGVKPYLGIGGSYNLLSW